MAHRVWSSLHHNPLNTAIVVLLATIVGSTGGCGGSLFDRHDGVASQTDAASSGELNSISPSYKLSLKNGPNFSRQSIYTMQGNDGEEVTGSYQESSRAVPPGATGNKKPSTYFDTTWKSPIGPDLAAAKLEFANSSPMSYENDSPTPYDGSEFDHQNSSSLFRYSLNSTGKEFRYGLQYFSIGKGFTALGKGKSNAKADKEGTELWGQWRLGDIGIKPLFSYSYDNLEADPDRPRLTDSQVGLRLDHSLMSWPYLGYSVTYLQGTRQSSLEPKDYQAFSAPISTTTFSVDYSASKWSASLFSSRSESDSTASGSSNQNTTYTHYLSGSYYPNKTISITGSFDHIRDEYQQWDATTVTNDASLSLSYEPTDGNFDRYFYVYYSGQNNPEWQLDTRSMSAGAGQRWYLIRKPSVISALTLDLSYDHYLDNIYSDASTKDLTVWLKYSYALGAKPMLASRLAYLTTPTSRNVVPAITRPATIDVPQIAQDHRPENLVTFAPAIEAANSPALSVAAREAQDEPSVPPLSDLPASNNWLGAQDAGQYTIQLSSSRQEQYATDFIRRHQLNGKAEYAAIEQDGVTSYKVLYGVYPDLATATAAAKALPASLQESGPWVRKISGLRAALKSQ